MPKRFKKEKKNNKDSEQKKNTILFSVKRGH
jgi:hypothetical protein